MADINVVFGGNIPSIQGRFFIGNAIFKTVSLGVIYSPSF